MIYWEYQWDRVPRDYSKASSSLLRLHLRADGSSCYFSFFCSHSLIPLTSRLRINYISIDWPLEGGIDIYGPPSAPRPMCIPQHWAPASCITPGLHFLCSSLRSKACSSAPGLPGCSHPLYAQDAQRCALTAQNGRQDCRPLIEMTEHIFGSFHLLDTWTTGPLSWPCKANVGF